MGLKLIHVSTSGPCSLTPMHVHNNIACFSFKSIFFQVLAPSSMSTLNLFRIGNIAKSRHLPWHYNDVIMGAIASKITSLTIIYSTVYSSESKGNIKAPRHWPLWGISPETDQLPAQMASNAENVSIWWRHHDFCRNICRSHYQLSFPLGQDHTIIADDLFTPLLLLH